jgi:hypothetical protein
MMLSKNLFIQIAMIIISIGIIVTFVEPTFSEIGGLQDDIAVYQTERQKVSSVNAQLDSLITVLNNVATDDQRRLVTYMPDEVDTINVVRDLSLISDEAEVVYISAAYVGEATSNTEQDDSGEAEFVQPQEYTFDLSIEGTYEQIKNLFGLLEQNNYPIDVQTLSIQMKDGGFLTADMGLSVYAHKSSVSNEEIVF